MRKFISKFHNSSVKWKFALTYFSILIIQIILTGYYLYIHTSNSAISQGKSVMEQNLMQTRAAILENEKVVENTASIITFDRNIQNFLDYEYESPIAKIEDYQFRFSPVMENLLKINNNIYSIRIYMNNAIVTERLDSFYSVNQMDNLNLYGEMLAKEPSGNGWGGTSEVLNNDNAKVQVVSYSSKIISMNTYKNTGILEIAVREDKLFSMLNNPVISKFGKVFVLNKENIIVSKNIPDLFRKSISSIGVKDFNGVERISDVEYVSGSKSIVINIPMEQLGLSVVGIFPVTNFNTQVKTSVVNIIIFLILSSLFLGVVVYVTTNILLRRIRGLVKAMKQVREGHLDVSVGVNSKDEFGELALSFNHMTKRIYELVEVVYKIELMEREAELKALEAHINPHFLYNTLAAITWSARKKNSEDVVNITNKLARFYRLVLNKGRTLISVKEEIDIIKAYLYIQKIRFTDMFDVVYKIDEGIYEVEIIKNILQPFVENALSHGIEPKRGHGTLIVKGELDNNRLIFEIIDDGIGMKRDTLESVLSGNVNGSSGSGYAVKNIMERLKAYYGENCSFDIFSKSGIGTVIRIEIGISIDKQHERGE